MQPACCSSNEREPRHRAGVPNRARRQEGEQRERAKPSPRGSTGGCSHWTWAVAFTVGRANEVGTILRWDDEKEDFYICYDNGDGDWATLSMFEEF